MKIVVYTGNDPKVWDHLKVLEVDRPEQVYGQAIVGLYPTPLQNLTTVTDTELSVWHRLWSRIPEGK